MHLSSLTGPGPIGTMGRPARAFADFLARAGQAYWQLLPIGPTGYGDSPYQSFCTYAGNPCFIDPETLAEQGLLDGWSGCADNPDRVDYATLWPAVRPVLERAAARFLRRPPGDFADFCTAQAGWLEDYARFMALKESHGGAAWLDWPADLRGRDAGALKDFCAEREGDIAFWKAVQYLFFDQWRRLKEYANELGVRLIGDLPIYTALDSVEVWTRPELFCLDGDGHPREVAGCPPDGFSPHGQRWGNPLYDWQAMEREGYRWWVERIDYLCRIFDVLRIDHFRGFVSYYAIPREEPDAKNGRWLPGPGMKLFQAVGERPILAEDLGFVTASVRQLLEESGFPGMKVLQFAFDRREGGGDYLPHNYPIHCVAYTGTHDNDTILGWLSHADPRDVARAVEYLRLGREEPHWDAMCALWGSPAELVIVTAQDLLGLGSTARMNTPGTLGNNWCWRAKGKSFTPELAQRLRRKMELYERL